MATMMYPTLTKSQSMRSKRKSAVELLAESKPFYVKSEIVRDTTQAIPTRLPNPGPLGYGGYNRSKSVNVAPHGTNYRPTTLPQYMAVSPSRSLPPLSHRRSVHLGSNDLLQNKLRQLLVCDSAEELSVEQMAPLSPPAEYAQRCHKSLPDLHCRAEPSSNKSSNKSLSNRDSGGSSGHYTQRSEPAPPPRQFLQDSRRDSGSSTQHSGGSSYYCCQEPDCRARQAYPPPSTFKRQKCLRYKRDRPILRSKSDISDRYWRPPEQPPTSHLEQFFEHLGMTSDSYEEMLTNSRSSESPVFFSDVSTVDSSRPLDNVDYCPSSFRTSEPPSIVERNARIIKWLCNCRKSQLT
ncbi:uncharacterized protein LOC655783 [Tribolium castaneum]|uniref:Centrosome-associated FAM110 C-terminal domain-containing protein n=1 Tax=Tribolium castaneum TaxID=7070 RepID=D6WRY6_TRICA|nr:PREDICTED: uncharacterized protein LOC655783 [Tribolium castaneum]EFA06418.2 hypothetical protein TcasGA2_TC009297 [Tribolium castaneum]|eukprot:XP_967438.2 PREDICTED: uncharacterized protein LOC655783 [Tribolium castaneum]